MAKFALVGAAVAGCSALTSFEGLTGSASTAEGGALFPDGSAGVVGDASEPTDAHTSDAAVDAGQANDGAAPLDYRANVLFDSPDLYWRFEDPAAVLDSSGNGHSGTILGGVMLGANGALAGGGHGASFVNGAISAGQVLAFQGNAPFSLEAWVSIPSGTYQCFLSRELDPADGYALFVSDGTLVLERENAGGPDHATSSIAIPTGVYTHVVGTYDGSTMRVYINGALVGAQSSTLGLPGAASVPFLAGDNNDGGTARFTGMLDELAVYHVALSGEAILRHYQVGTGK